jgi:DNA segregation ATPase FtsK/SpoIIIE-like protein
MLQEPHQMNDATTGSTFSSDYQRARAIQQAEGRVSASLLQRRLGIGYISALHLVSELNRKEPPSAIDVRLALDSRTFYLLLAIYAGRRGDGDIGIDEDELEILLTGNWEATTVTVISAVGQAVGPDRACLAVHNAVGTSKEVAHAILRAKKLVVIVSAAPATLMGRELKIILRELRRHVGEFCSISLGIDSQAPSGDDIPLCQDRCRVT